MITGRLSTDKLIGLNPRPGRRQRGFVPQINGCRPTLIMERLRKANKATTTVFELLGILTLGLGVLPNRNLTVPGAVILQFEMYAAPNL